MEPTDESAAAPGTASPPPVNAPNTKTLQRPHPISHVPDSPSDSPAKSLQPPSSHDFSNFTPAVDLQNLREDRLLSTATKADFKGTLVPYLGGIPLIAKLGQGGMGAVYYGVHPRLKQEVAVKVLPFPLLSQNPNMLERFYREAQIAAKVKSPRVVTVLDVNEEHGLFYLVMEYVSGLSAGSYTKRHYESRQLPEAIALEIVIAATEGLQAAHEQGVIHRDIKPDNILIPMGKADFSFKQAKLADLGLARSEESGASLTGVNSAMGTPGFMSPEQALDAKNARKPADIFSMGAALYDLLCGQPPFVGESLTKVIIATLSEPHAPMTQFRSDLSPETMAVVDRCLKKEAPERFYDAGELLDALRAARWKANTGAPLPAAPVIPTAQQPTLARTMSNNPMQAGFAFGTGNKGSTIPPLSASPGIKAGAPAPMSSPVSAGEKFANRPAFTPTVLSKPGGTGARAGAKPAFDAPMYYPEEKKSSSGKYLYLAGAVLCAGVIGYALFGRDPFPKDRDELMSQTQPLLSGSTADLNHGLEMVKDFETRYVDKSVADMQPVRELQQKFDTAIGQKRTQEIAAAHKQGALEVQTPTPPDELKQLFTDIRMAENVKDYGKIESLALQGKQRWPQNPAWDEKIATVRRLKAQDAQTQAAPTPNTQPAVAALSPEIEKDLADARDFMQSGNFASAEKRFRRTLDNTEFAKTPKGDETRRMADLARKAQQASSSLDEAERYLLGGKYQEAKDSITAAKQAYYQAPLKDKIDALYSKLESKYKEDSQQDRYDKLMSEGRRQLQEGHFREALFCFKQILQYKPDDQAAREGKNEAEARMAQSGNIPPPQGGGGGGDGFAPPPPDGQQPGGPQPTGTRPPVKRPR